MTTLAHRVEAAIGRGEWSGALGLLDAAGDEARTPELLALRATAAYGAGDFEGAVGAWEERYARLLNDGDREGAAASAASVAMLLLVDSGLMSPVRGWMARAGELLEDAPVGPTHAVLAAVSTYERFMCGDLGAARRSSELAMELGGRFGERAAEVIGRTAAARLDILEGAVDVGIARLEDVGAVLMSGEVDPLTTGMMLCEIVCAAQGLARPDLAAEWTDAMDRWARNAALGGIRGRCRVHKAELLRMSGPCDDAEAEALGACDDLRPWMRREFGWPLAELGNIRLRKGDLAGAEEAFRAAHRHVWCPHPGLALVHLARGDVGAAVELIDEAVVHPMLIPSKERPPFIELTLAPLLEAQVEISAVAGDRDTATRAAGTFRAVADRFGSPWLLAAASLAEARVALLVGDRVDAVQRAGDAVGAFAGVGAPYETAVARTVLARALDAHGNTSGAALEWRAAADGFEAYGAHTAAKAARAAVVGQVVSTPEARPADGGAASEDAVFRRDGDVRVVTFRGRSHVLRDLKGFRYLARLLADPGREFHVLDLVSVEQGTLPTGGTGVVGPSDAPDGSRAAPGEGLPVIDDRARDAYRRRLAEIEDELDDARRCNDPVRAELAEADRDYLVAELSRAVGLGGRLRRVGADAERARTAVARTLRYAIDRLAEVDGECAAHLAAGVSTGTYCSYRPDPLCRVAWAT